MFGIDCGDAREAREGGAFLPLTRVKWPGQELDLFEKIKLVAILQKYVFTYVQYTRGLYLYPTTSGKVASLNSLHGCRRGDRTPRPFFSTSLP